MSVDKLVEVLAEIKKREKLVKDLVWSIKTIESADRADKTKLEVVTDEGWKKVSPIAVSFLIESYNKQLKNEYSSYKHRLEELRGNGVDIKISVDFEENSKYREELNGTLVNLPY